MVKIKTNIFYELELVQEVKSDSDMPYIVKGSENDVSTKRLLEVMGEFFNIRRR